MMKVLRAISGSAFLAALVMFCGHAHAADIAVLSLKVTYTDDVTTPGKAVERELTSLHDDPYWSKPEKVNVAVEIENKGKETARFISIVPEHYYLLQPRESSLPPMTGELRTITREPVWVWTSTLGSEAIRELAAGEKRTITFSDLPVRSRYYATSYDFKAFAIRVSAEPRDGDDNYSDNVKEKIIGYGD
jgi:hypothetical protein